jgi:hypothetical protein
MKANKIISLSIKSGILTYIPKSNKFDFFSNFTSHLRISRALTRVNLDKAEERLSRSKYAIENKIPWKERLRLVKDVAITPFLIFNPFDDLGFLLLGLTLSPVLVAGIIVWGGVWGTKQVLQRYNIIPDDAKKLEKLLKMKESTLNPHEKDFFRAAIAYRQTHPKFQVSISTLTNLKKTFIEAFDAKDVHKLMKFCSDVDDLLIYNSIEKMELTKTINSLRVESIQLFDEKTTVDSLTGKKNTMSKDVRFLIDGYMVQLSFKNGTTTNLYMEKNRVNVHCPSILKKQKLEITLSLELIAYQIFIRKICLPMLQGE